MFSQLRLLLAGMALVGLTCSALAQEPAQPPSKPEEIPVPQPKLPPPPARDAVAATVNGEPIFEIAVYRALTRIHPQMWEVARQEVLGYLVENKLVDQYLEKLQIPVDEKEVSKRIDQVREEIKKQGQDPDKFLKDLFLTPEELRAQVVGSLRWDNFTDKYAPEDKLKQMFDQNKEMFNGSLVKAKHVLIKPATQTKEAVAQAQAKAATLRQQIEAQVAQKLAALPAGTDNLAREQERRKAIDEVFGEVAKKESDCPSKAQGGELGWFPRLGKMVEPFARAAFALKPFEISAPVETEFGAHLILPTEVKEGRDVTYDQVKEFVREVYAERLREAVLSRMRPAAKIEIKKT